MRLTAVLLFVDDFEAALAFYTRTMGFEVSNEESGEGYRRLVDWALLETGDAALELFAADVHGAGWQLPMPRRNAAVAAFEVDNLDDAVADLTGRGVDFGPGVQAREWGRYVYLDDPEGNRIQLYQRHDGGTGGGTVG